MSSSRDKDDSIFDRASNHLNGEIELDRSSAQQTNEGLSENFAKEKGSEFSKDFTELTLKDEISDSDRITRSPSETASSNEPDSKSFNQEERDRNPSLNKLMMACQEGNIEEVKHLISSGQVRALDTFSDKITGLHWAAINNRLSIVRYLIENKHSPADPNALGGDLRASPLHWACRNGLVYLVDYFLRHTDADPSLRDSQSYNALHLAVHSSNISLVIYILLSCCDASKGSPRIFIDETDSSNRTSLHWAAYQGDYLTVNALLHFGANVNKVDDSLFLPIHWAFMKGQRAVLKSLVEAGSNIYAKNNQNKTTFEVAKDMNCYQTWIKVLNECGRTAKDNWEIKQPFLTKKMAKLITFCLPFISLAMVFKVCSFYKGLIIPKLFASGLLFSGSMFYLKKYVIPAYMLEDNALPKSPFLAGIFAGTAFWCILVWAFSILPTLFWTNFLANLIMFILIVMFTWSFTKAILLNPGFVPVPTDNHQILLQVYELLDKGKFDSENFCYNSFIRKPLRSKYSRFSKRVIARFDHFCPWVYNDIGVRNHKLFMFFVYSLLCAILLFIYLSLKLFENTETNSGYDSDDNKTSCHFLNDELCVGFQEHHFLFNLMVWTTFQMIWIMFLVCVQTFQICKGLTTYEFSLLDNKNKIDESNNSTTLPPEMRGNSHKQFGHRHNGYNMCARLIGLDQFLLTLKLSIESLVSRTHHSTFSPLDALEIPTDYGIKRNWLDFWFLGDVSLRNLFYLPIEGENCLNGQLVDYYKLYEYPPKHSDTLV